jgi:hypothetical protein
VVVLIGVPVVFLTPLFWLDSNLPQEAGLRPMLAPLMSLVLIALVLTVTVNVLGAFVVVGRALLGAGRRG